MPIVTPSYNPPLIFKNAHFSTIYAGIFRKVAPIAQHRERIELPDGDFLDLDWSFAGVRTQKVAILLHGLEGHGQRPYMTGAAKQLNENGYDACAVNFRGCSGETNRLFRSYHSGATEDLAAVVNHILTNKSHSLVYLKGFSLGGNLALKYLGEGRILPSGLKAAVAVSVPCDLYSSLTQLLTIKNRAYSNRFKKHLKDKLWPKLAKFPHLISAHEIKQIKTLQDFDDIYTSKAHGFKDAIDYYEKSSCRQFLPNIKIPSLIINALDDTFLGQACYPYQEAEKNPCLYLETPRHGGHVGFYGPKNATYTEKRTIKFFNRFN